MSRPQSDPDPASGDSGAFANAASAGPGRADRADKARNRARIMIAAAEAFAERGIDTQMDDVAARAGLGVGTLYRHFATKEALMVALLERKFQQILEVVRDGLARPDGDPFEVFCDVIRRGAEVAATDAAAQDALARTGHAVWSAVESTLSELEATTQVLIDRAQRAGSMRLDVSADDIPMLMRGISATMSSREWDWRRHLELTLDGLRTQAHRPD